MLEIILNLIRQNNIENQVGVVNDKLINSKFMDKEKEIILKLIEDFQVFLNSLSTAQLCILIDMLGIIVIILCLITIIFSFYGNIIVDKLALEAKFPRLASYIRLRKKLMQFYILTNILYITALLSFMMYVNFITFVHLY